MKKNAKKEALKMLSDEMRELMGDSYKDGMKGIGVKVMADSPKAAAEGLEKAKKIMEARSEEKEESEDEKEEKEEKNYEDMSKEELIKCLMDK